MRTPYCRRRPGYRFKIRVVEAEAGGGLPCGDKGVQRLPAVFLLQPGQDEGGIHQPSLTAHFLQKTVDPFTYCLHGKRGHGADGNFSMPQLQQMPGGQPRPLDMIRTDQRRVCFRQSLIQQHKRAAEGETGERGDGLAAGGKQEKAGRTVSGLPETLLFMLGIVVGNVQGGDKSLLVEQAGGESASALVKASNRCATKAAAGSRPPLPPARRLCARAA